MIVSTDHRFLIFVLRLLRLPFDFNLSVAFIFFAGDRFETSFSQFGRTVHRFRGEELRTYTDIGIDSECGVQTFTDIGIAFR